MITTLLVILTLDGIMLLAGIMLLLFSLTDNDKVSIAIALDIIKYTFPPLLVYMWIVNKKTKQEHEVEDVNNWLEHKLKYHQHKKKRV